MALLMLRRGPARDRAARRSDLLAGPRRRLAVAAWLAVGAAAGDAALFDGAFVVDGFARFMKVLTLVGAAGAWFLSFRLHARDTVAEVRVSRCWCCWPAPA